MGERERERAGKRNEGIGEWKKKKSDRILDPAFTEARYSQCYK